VYPHGDGRLRAQEVGASIFVEANRHLVKAAKVRLLTSYHHDH
jgi:prenylcysteine oxidase/farnesylcysteine lyase